MVSAGHVASRFCKQACEGWPVVLARVPNFCLAFDEHLTTFTLQNILQESSPNYSTRYLSGTSIWQLSDQHFPGSLPPGSSKEKRAWLQGWARLYDFYYALVVEDW